MVMIKGGLLWEYYVCGRLVWLQNCHEQVVDIVVQLQAESDLKFHDKVCFIHKLQVEAWALLKQWRFRRSIAVPFHNSSEVPSRNP